jgi:hypothetical protein
MSTLPDFDRTAREWLADGPRDLSDRVLQAALDKAFLTGRRRRGVGAPSLPSLRGSVHWTEPGGARAALAAIAMVAVVAVAGALIVRLQPGVGGTATTPGPSATPVSTSDSAAFSSERFGYTVSLPNGWTRSPATRDWTLEQDRARWLTTAADRFESPTGGDWLFTAFSVPWGDGPTDGFVGAFHDQAECLAKHLAAVTVDGVAGDEFEMCGAVQAIATNHDRLYTFSLWQTRPNEALPPDMQGGPGLIRTDPLPLFQAILANIDLQAAKSQPQIDTTDWVHYHSARYGFSLSHPPGWSTEAATRDWTLADRFDWLTPAAEQFVAPPADLTRLAAWSVALASGQSYSEFMGSYHTLNCGSGQIETVNVATETGDMMVICQRFQGVVGHGGRVYVFTMWPTTEGDPRPPPSTGHIALYAERVLPLLRTVLSTVEFE